MWVMVGMMAGYVMRGHNVMLNWIIVLSLIGAIVLAIKGGR
jgi:hypothetical protein